MLDLRRSDAPDSSALGTVSFGERHGNATCVPLLRGVGPACEGWFGEDALFVAVERPADDPRTAALDAYAAVFAACDAAGFPHLARLHNYLPQVTGLTAGVERYWAFNVGRHEAFLAAGRQTQAPPAATAVGTPSGNLVVTALATRTPVECVENPRQLAAWRYPERYGPRSPTFSRAARLRRAGQDILFVSGTASIVGHESRHPGDLAAQLAETVANLSAVMAAGETVPEAKLWLRAYVRYAADMPLVAASLRAAFPAASLAAVEAEICRAELLVEVEAVAIRDEGAKRP